MKTMIQRNRQPCRRIAMVNGKCRLHRGMVLKHNPGRKTEEGKRRQHMVSWKREMRSKAAIGGRHQVREYIRQYKQAI